MATAIITTGRMIMTVRSFALLTILVTGYTLAVEQLLVRKRINALEVDAKKTRKLGSVGSDEQTASKGFGSILQSTKEYKGDKAWEDVSYSFKGDNKAIDGYNYGKKEDESTNRYFKTDRKRAKPKTFDEDYDVAGAMMFISMSMPPSETEPSHRPTPKPRPTEVSPNANDNANANNANANADTPSETQITPSPFESPVGNGSETSEPITEPIIVDSNAPTSKRTLSPTPVSSSVSISRDEAMKQILENVTDSSILEDPTTPQGIAFEWIMDNDLAQVDPNSYLTVKQRYALAVFYHSTNGDDWLNADGWLSYSNECSWAGIKCGEDNLVDEIGSEGIFIANGLSGEIPSEIKVFESLEIFQVGNNAIGGSIPDVLDQLTQLRLFDVEINLLSGPAYVKLDGLDQLESYRISANKLSGTIDQSIGDIASLRELWMADNQITGSIPNSIGSLTNIETIYLYRNNIVGTLPSSMDQMKKLKELQIFQNFFSGTIPEGFYSNTNLGLMRLDRNQFTGTISDSIGNLNKLGDMRIDENLFSGKLPASLMNLSNLVVLRVNDNNFVGTIKDGFDQWGGLDFADFRNNGFEGTLPSSIFDIPTIRILYFANNNIDGKLPSTYGNSPVLRDLFLSGNSLTGTIPEIEVGQLAQLTELLLEDNKFIGTMAESICNLRVSGQGILEDVWVDCGEAADPRLECDVPGCCTACFPSGP